MPATSFALPSKNSMAAHAELTLYAVMFAPRGHVIVSETYVHIGPVRLYSSENTPPRTTRSAADMFKHYVASNVGSGTAFPVHASASVRTPGKVPQTGTFSRYLCARSTIQLPCMQQFGLEHVVARGSTAFISNICMRRAMYMATFGQICTQSRVVPDFVASPTIHPPSYLLYMTKNPGRL